MDTARCSPMVGHDIRPGRPLKEMTADDPMNMIDAPLKNMVHQGGKIHWADKKYFYSNHNTKLLYLLIMPYLVIILIEETRSDCGGGCFNVRNCYHQACKKCPRCRHWKGGKHVDGQLN